VGRGPGRGVGAAPDRENKAKVLYGLELFTQALGAGQAAELMRKGPEARKLSKARNSCLDV